MLLDPFTIIAQIVNFAILVYALKHFLYDRVLAAMDQRESTIAARLHDAETREAVAAARIQEYENRRRELDGQEQDMLDAARRDADRHRRRLLEEARRDIDGLRDRWERSLRAEQRETALELRRRTAHEVLGLSRQALSDLAGVELESLALDRALDHLAGDADALQTLLGSSGTEAPLVVRTGFAVPFEQRHRVTERLRSLGLPASRTLEFVDEDDLILGVELDGDGTAVSWHADDYLERLEASVERLIDDAEADSDAD